MSLPLAWMYYHLQGLDKSLTFCDTQCGRCTISLFVSLTHTPVLEPLPECLCNAIHEMRTNFLECAKARRNYSSNFQDIYEYSVSHILHQDSCTLGISLFSIFSHSCTPLEQQNFKCCLSENERFIHFSEAVLISNIHLARSAN